MTDSTANLYEVANVITNIVEDARLASEIVEGVRAAGFDFVDNRATGERTQS